MHHKLISVITFLVFSIFVPSVASADMGPKPSTDIYVTLNNQTISDNSFYAKMLTCQTEDIVPFPISDLIPQLNINDYDTKNLCYWKPEGLAWGGNCQNSSCNFTYMLPSAFKLAIYVPSLKKVFITDQISRNNFKSNYSVELSLDGSARIFETTPIISSDKVRSFLIMIIPILLVELFIAFLYILIAKFPKKILLAVFLANLLSLLVVLFVISSIKNWFLYILFSAVFTLVFEYYFIYFLNKKTTSFSRLISMVVIMNFLSLIFALFVVTFLRYL